MILAWIAALALAAAPAPAAAQHEVAAQALFQQLMSPFCPGLLLANCPSAPAIALRAEIERRLAAGESAAAIEAGLERRYGDAVLAAPRASGWGLIGWVMPGAAMLLGTVATVGWLLRHSGTQPAATAPPQPPDPAHLAILDREIGDS